MKPTKRRMVQRIAEADMLVHPNGRVELTMPIVLVSEANQREHWRTRHARKKTQQKIAAACLTIYGRIDRVRVDRVLITRMGGRKLDSDNLVGSGKHVRDAIARWLGIDDGDERITWSYAQESGPLKGVRVTFEEEQS